jgi:hypothetical protein
VNRKHPAVQILVLFGGGIAGCFFVYTFYVLPIESAGHNDYFLTIGRNCVTFTLVIKSLKANKRLSATGFLGYEPQDNQTHEINECSYTRKDGTIYDRNCRQSYLGGPDSRYR